MDVNSAWQVTNEVDALPVVFNVNTKDIGFWGKVGHVLFGDGEIAAQRKAICGAAEQFGQQVKREIESTLVPQVAYTIGTIKVEPDSITAPATTKPTSAFYPMAERKVRTGKKNTTKIQRGRS